MKSYFTLLTLLLSIPLLATEPIHTAIIQSNVKTLRLRYADEETLQRPFLQLHGDDVLEISFDELSHTSHQYSYTVLHLNADFTPSDLQSFEYLQGFTTADITDYDYSQNTQQLYTHYRFTFPNEDMQPLVSGNYAIKIYEDGDPDNVVAYQTFQVVEEQVAISAKITGNTSIEFSGRYQQLELDINTQQLAHFTNPEQVTVVVQQNNRWDNAVFAPQATYIGNNLLQYKNHRALIFEGGNEYRRFDIASTYILGYGVDKIDFDQHFYHAFLFPSENRTHQPYVTELDTDGQFIINAERTDDDDYEADYMWVHFFLPQDNIWFDGSLYVAGDLFQNSFASTNRMQYDENHRCYTLSAYLKQGGYDYQYLFVPKNVSKATTLRAEGSHWETENEYTIYVYFRPFGARADQLVGRQSLR